MTTAREQHLVELVDDGGAVVGETTVAAAHQPPGQLHRAFSVLLVDPAGRVLLQQRAAVKTRFPLRWANSCCGHPEPGQSLRTAANRRLVEELGVGPVGLTEVGVHLYFAEDPATGRVEFEYDHVLRADFAPDQPLRPDPAEVADLRWVDPEELRADIDANPGGYAPWLVGVIDRYLLSVPATAGPAGTTGVPASAAAGLVDNAAEPPGGR
ncbi:isopentenyl-diphosphate Delta-isomerase [Micromonospora sp. NBC_01796]|uniref:isopentenyl-diphosphate Delta-isomerase n=1 Tax=Micromonospora sp. NBC_01796 TaxID=2975987 RepID=UPI002DD9E995|nr:isopentenyl-diphosphate Delta-isomerase [Micromonospora sp. NBC_01796]WSA88810.1 isopentenyl-diphosphate Delta-isomerase [Micromonospora sp. NBC_01796]